MKNTACNARAQGKRNRFRRTPLWEEYPIGWMRKDGVVVENPRQNGDDWTVRELHSQGKESRRSLTS